MIHQSANQQGATEILEAIKEVHVITLNEEIAATLELAMSLLKTAVEKLDDLNATLEPSAVQNAHQSAS
jgi:hypothetical protein